MFQFQVAYRDRIRQFYVDQVLEDYSAVIQNIVLNISSLFGAIFQVQYLNDEGMWITLSESLADLQDMFRCARTIEATENKRVKIKIIEGCSPAPVKKTKPACPPDEPNARKRRLPFEDTYTYKTPIDLDIERKESDLICLENELSYLEAKYIELSEKYVTKINRRGKQCGSCHLYQNHRKNNCPNDTCVSALMCGDIAKHQDETAELREIENKSQKLKTEIKKEKLDLQQKLKCKEKVCDTFSKKIEVQLINSDKDRYLIETTFGLKPKQALINEHVAILEKHYRGKIPANVECERPLFRKVINDALSAVPPKRTHLNILTDNALYPVNFPATRPPVASPPPPPTFMPPLPQGPPPMVYPPLPPSTQSIINATYQPTSMASPYDRYGWYPWFPVGNDTSRITRDDEEINVCSTPGQSSTDVGSTPGQSSTDGHN